MTKFTALNEALHDYIVAHGVREDDALAQLREETAALGDISSMQIAPEQGAFMTMLAKVIGARRAIEVGTFTGYSAICTARGLTEDGVLIACELDPERAATAAKSFARAGIAERIDLRVGPALETLRSLDDDGAYDLAFIDADKTGYPDYYEECLRLLRPGGLILLDNVLMDGRVLDPPEGDEGAAAMDQLNREIHDDERVELAMIPVADGLTIARKL